MTKTVSYANVHLTYTADAAGLRQAKADMAAMNRVINQTKTDTQKYEEHVQKLDRLLANGKITQEQYNRGLEAARKKYLETNKEVAKAIDYQKQYNTALANNKARLAATPTTAKAQEDSFEVPEGGIETDIVLGDFFELGRHRLLCGDSANAEHVARLMNGERADLLLTDPPYGIGIDGQKESKAKNPKHNRKHHEFRGWDDKRPEKATFELMLSLADKVIIWGGNYFADLLPATRGWIYWSKGQDGLTMSDGELAWTSEDKPLRSVTVNRAALQGSVHPTQKPLQVISFCLDWAGNPKLIADTFLGSGSTMVACHQSDRICYGLEIDPKYCQVIINRMLALDPSLEITKNGIPYGKD